MNKTAQLVTITCTVPDELRAPEKINVSTNKRYRMEG